MSSERFVEHIVDYPALSVRVMEELLYSRWLFENECQAIFNVVKVYESIRYNCVLRGITLVNDKALMMDHIIEGSDLMKYIVDLGCAWSFQDTVDECMTGYLKDVFVKRNEEAIAEKLAKLVVDKTKKHIDNDIRYYLVKEAVERCYEFIADEKTLYKKELDVYSLFSFLKKENEQNKEVSECLIRLGNAECSVKYIYKLRSLGYKVLLKSQYEGYLDKTKEMLCVESPNGNVFSISSHWTEEEAVKTILNFIDKI